jgi:NAD dependent epimerase/dehydratase family enzyme
MGLDVITDILVRGKRVIPARASALGYQFSFPVLDAALHRSAITSEVASAPGSAPRT